MSELLSDLGFWGVFVSGFFGITGIIIAIYFWKRKVYPKSITFLNQAEFNIFDSIAKSFEEITISYDLRPIKENIVYVKGVFVNDGQKDIDGKNAENPLMIVNENIRWLKCKITNKSKKLKCIYKIENNRLIFNLGVFRKKEYFEFEALVEVNDPDFKIENNIEHRIANVKPKTKTIYFHRELLNKKFSRIKFVSITGAAILVILIPIYFHLANKVKEHTQKFYEINTEFKLKADSIDRVVEFKKITRDSINKTSSFLPDSFSVIFEPGGFTPHNDSIIKDLITRYVRSAKILETQVSIIDNLEETKSAQNKAIRISEHLNQIVPIKDTEKRFLILMEGIIYLGVLVCILSLLFLIFFDFDSQKYERILNKIYKSNKSKK